MRQSDINIEDVDLTKALRYIYIVGGPELINRAGLNRISPKWMGKRADLLSVTGKKSNGNELWRDSNKEIYRWEAKRIVATVVEIGIILAMGTHLYSFNGVTYIQCVGGPIGLRLTAALANLIMCFY